MFESLPLELIVDICGYLASHDLCNVVSACKSWHQSLNNEHVMELLSTKRWCRKGCSVDKYFNSWRILCKNDNLRNKCSMWSWDPTKCGSGIKISNFDKVARFDSESIPCQVLCKQPCICPERYYIELEVISSRRGSLNIGLNGSWSGSMVSDPTDLEHRCGFGRDGCSFSLFSNTIFHNNSWIECDCPTPMEIDCMEVACTDVTTFAVKSGTRVGMGIDMNKKRISFFRNGNLQGVLHLDSLKSWLSFCDKVYPSLSMGDSGDCVVIVDEPNIPKF